MIKFSIFIFFTFSNAIGVSKISCQISIYYEQQNSCFFNLFSENLRPPLIFLVPSLGWEFGKMRKWSHFLKNTARVEIKITINVENCRNLWARGFVILHANCYANCYYNFNPCGIFEKMTSFSPIFNPDLEQGKLMAAVDSRK